MSNFFIQVVLSLLLVYNVPGAKVEESTICHLGNNVVTYLIESTESKPNNFYIEGLSEFDTLDILATHLEQVTVIGNTIYLHYSNAGDVVILFGKTIGSCTEDVPNVISSGRIYFPFYVNDY